MIEYQGLNIITDEIKLLKRIFPWCKDVIDSINNNQDSTYLVIFNHGFNNEELEKAKKFGFIFEHASAIQSGIGVSFSRLPICKHCNKLQNDHTCFIYCDKLPDLYGPYKIRYKFTPITETERYKKYGKKYYGGLIKDKEPKKILKWICGKCETKQDISNNFCVKCGSIGSLSMDKFTHD